LAGDLPMSTSSYDYDYVYEKNAAVDEYQKDSYIGKTICCTGISMSIIIIIIIIITHNILTNNILTYNTNNIYY
jgi:hypothetical protein